MQASQFAVLALIFTSAACVIAPDKPPRGHDSDTVNAAANRFRYRTVPDGDSTVTTAAASPDAWMPVTVYFRFPVGALSVTVTPAFVPTPEPEVRLRTFPKNASPPNDAYSYAQW